MKAKKEKYTIWIKPSTMDAVKRVYKTDNCGTQSEFVEKAILFYLGYLSAEEQKTYLPNIVTSTLKGIVAESDKYEKIYIYSFAFIFGRCNYWCCYMFESIFLYRSL